jgi:demethoxyubiquinone hydroxylase (CLK1/Coq7/Cat5 family)
VLVLAGPLAGRAEADVISDTDLAYARLLVGAELLAADFYGQAIAAKHFDGRGSKYLKRALFNEQEHYASVALILTGAGQTPAVAADIDFAYPNGSFASKGSIAALGAKLETVFLGAYLGAVGAVQALPLKLPLARIAASEAQHLSSFDDLLGRNAAENSFPDPLSIDEASNALDAYAS